MFGTCIVHLEMNPKIPDSSTYCISCFSITLVTNCVQCDRDNLEHEDERSINFILNCDGFCLLLKVLH